MEYSSNTMFLYMDAWIVFNSQIVRKEKEK